MGLNWRPLLRPALVRSTRRARKRNQAAKQGVAAEAPEAGWPSSRAAAAGAGVLALLLLLRLRPLALLLLLRLRLLALLLLLWLRVRRHALVALRLRVPALEVDLLAVELLAVELLAVVLVVDLLVVETCAAAVAAAAAGAAALGAGLASSAARAVAAPLAWVAVVAEVADPSVACLAGLLALGCRPSHLDLALASLATRPSPRASLLRRRL